MNLKSILTGIATLGLISAFTVGSVPSQAASVPTGPNTVVGPSGPSCENLTQTDAKDWTTFQSSVTSTTFRYGIQLTAAGATAVNGAATGTVQVYLQSGTVWNPSNNKTYYLNALGMYGLHSYLWSDVFHASASVWDLANSNKTLAIHNGQIVTLTYQVKGMLGGYYAGPFSCQIQGFGNGTTP